MILFDYPGQFFYKYQKKRKKKVFKEHIFDF